MTAISLHIRVAKLPRKSISRTGSVNTRKSSRCGSDSSSRISVNPLIALQIGGGLLAGAAALAGGVYAYEKHKKGKVEEEVSPTSPFLTSPYLPSSKDQGPPPGYPPPDSQQRPEHGSGHSFGIGKVGALAAGAATVGAGAYAYHEHEKHKKENAEEEVSSLLHLF